MDDISIDRASEIPLLIQEHGIVGALLFTGEAPGAIRRGMRIEKCNSVDGDSNIDGAMGTVISSIDTSDVPTAPSDYAYFVQWDNPTFRGAPVFITGDRVKTCVEEKEGEQTHGDRESAQNDHR